jgi:hypothetical protein
MVGMKFFVGTSSWYYSWSKDGNFDYGLFTILG